jgi:hypothetical protein
MYQNQVNENDREAGEIDAQDDLLDDLMNIVQNEQPMGEKKELNDLSNIQFQQVNQFLIS